MLSINNIHIIIIDVLNFYKCFHTVGILVQLAFCTQQCGFEIHPHPCAYLWLTHFYTTELYFYPTAWIAWTYCNLLARFSCDRHLGYFQFFFFHKQGWNDHSCGLFENSWEHVSRLLFHSTHCTAKFMGKTWTALACTLPWVKCSLGQVKESTEQLPNESRRAPLDNWPFPHAVLL